jgi:hypothetical protein
MMDGYTYDALLCAVKPIFWNLGHENLQVHQPHMRRNPVWKLHTLNIVEIWEVSNLHIQHDVEIFR